MSLATQMQRFKDIRDAIRNAIHTRNNEVEVDDLKFADFANVISTLNNINTETYTVPTEPPGNLIDLGEYNNVRKVQLIDFREHMYAKGINAGWDDTTASCSLSQGGWSSNKLTVTGTATARNSLKGGATKTGTATTTVDATSIYNNGYNAGRTIKVGSFTSAARKSAVTINCGFTPTYVAISCRAGSASYGWAAMYCNGTYYYHRATSSPSNSITTDGSQTGIRIITNGFTAATPDISNFGGKTVNYIAVR